MLRCEKGLTARRQANTPRLIVSSQALCALVLGLTHGGMRALVARVPTSTNATLLDLGPWTEFRSRNAPRKGAKKVAVDLSSGELRCPFFF